MSASAPPLSTGSRLVGQVICPHCWHRFPPEDVLWIAEHFELLGDMLLGPEKQRRFLPSRFTPLGDAIDEKGLVCRDLACPQCHLPVPRGLVESESVFLSMMGAPSSGKSYFLAAATWKLREVLTNAFGVTFQDADPSANRALNDAEEALFHNVDPDRIYVPKELIKKTDLVGDLYDSVSYGQHSVIYPRPYMFSLQGHERHPLHGRTRLDQMLCLYDNAGEHWLPGAEIPTRPLTRHLALSRVLLYLFDPTQDRRFREAFERGRPDGPSGGMAVGRQETILSEASARIRRYCGLAQNAKIDRPLIVVLPKFDAWSHLLENPPTEEPWVFSPKLNVSGFSSDQVDQVSHALHLLLKRYCPETVASAEALSHKVIYIPVSALGSRGMVLDPTTGKWGVRPSSIRPFWVTVPFLYSIQMTMPGLIPRVVRRGGAESKSTPR